MNQELRSQVQFVHNTDLAQFVYLLHALAGDFKQDLKINMEVLLSGSREFIAIMGKQHIHLYEVQYAYQSGYDWYQKMHDGDYQSGYAFLFQGNWQEDMQFWGNVLMFDIQVLLKDMERHTIFPSQTICKELSTAKQHYVTFSEELKKNAYSILDIDLLEELNQQYLKDAKHPQDGFSRISRDMAKQMIISGDTPVYRLLPEGPEKITLFAAVMTGLWYESYREFAIRTDDLSAIYHACYRELVRFIRGKIKYRTEKFYLQSEQ